MDDRSVPQLSVLVMLIGSLIMIVALPSFEGTYTHPEVTLVMDEPPPNATVTNELGDIVTFTGTAVYDLNGHLYESCEVEISGYSDWRSLDVGDGPVLRFENGTTELRFMINVSVPAGCYAGLKGVRLAGYYHLETETVCRNIVPVSSHLNVTAYRNITLELLHDDEVRITQGDEATLSLNMINNGNTYDEFELIFKGVEKFEEYGIDLEFERSKYSLSHEQEYIAHVFCNVTKDAKTGMYEVIVAVRPSSWSEDDILIVNELVFTIHIMEFSLDYPGFAPLMLSVMVLLIPIVIFKRIRAPRS